MMTRDAPAEIISVQTQIHSDMIYYAVGFCLGFLFGRRFQVKENQVPNP